MPLFPTVVGARVLADRTYRDGRPPRSPGYDAMNSSAHRDAGLLEARRGSESYNSGRAQGANVLHGGHAEMGS